MENHMKLTVLGSRGSMPVSGKEYEEFGGATTCYQVEAGDQVILLDSGTGIFNAKNIDERMNVSIIISHVHLDHIMGLPFFPELSRKGRRLFLYGEEKLDIKNQINTIFSKPYWPLMAGEYPSELVIESIKFPLKLGEVIVEGMNVRHPGGNIALKVIYKGKKIVNLSDYEHIPGENGLFADRDVIEFCRDADMVLYDAQYTDDEYSGKKGYGHSTESEGVKLKKSAGIKKMLLVHHDPAHDDEFLRNIESKIGDENVSFARQGQIINV
ncbi:MBL fold metallo-hydrolase [Butyrivibrio sp. LC3010]|uniref:MBL fold metallo-hydrolase n=1 Tax=Butyrivibrio sp. LC3010 TaxID=1280680 RepID=UPI0018CAEDF6|nr:MBL fold metallo-hydrolase [Butyrivibrio sp. LC3010]